MGELYTYNATHLTLVDAEEPVEFTQRAAHGDVGSGSFTIDDTAGTLSLVGQKDFAHTESSCSFPLTFRGFVGQRTYERPDAPKVTTARKIAVSLEDLNSMLGHRLIYQKSGLTAAEGGNRPAETVAARGAWLMASSFVAFSDLGRCSFPSDKGMDAADYRYQHPGDVLADMALAAEGYNYHVNDWGSGPELTFRDDNASTADSSTLRISNVLSDASAVTLNPKGAARLTRNPARVISKQAFSYSKGTLVEERAATATAFNGERAGTASNSNVKTSATAVLRSEAELWQLHTEEDIIECSIDAVTSAQINLILPGMRLQAKFSHLVTEGYGSFTYFRVLERTVRPLVADGGLYELDLKLSPQEEAEPAPPEASIVQSAGARSGAGATNLTLPNPVTIGNLLVFLVSDRGTSSPAGPSTSASAARFGAGAWTKLPNTTNQTGVGTGCAIWYKTADATDNTGKITNTESVFWLFEIAGATIAGATTLDESEHANGMTMDAGDFVSATSGSVMLALIAWNDQRSKSSPALPGVAPASGFVTDIFNSAGSSGGLAHTAPFSWIGHALGTGATQDVSITRSDAAVLSGIWMAVAIQIEPV